MPEPFDVGEEVRSAAFGEDRSEHLAEQFDVIPKLLGDFLSGTVAFCAYRCHRPDHTEIAHVGRCAGVYFDGFANALIIVTPSLP
ncbi:hypothetical protein GCM10026982_15840 [Nocardiopsis aegyptia]